MFGNFSHLLNILENVCVGLILLVFQQKLLQLYGVHQQLILLLRQEEVVTSQVVKGRSRGHFSLRK